MRLYSAEMLFEVQHYYASGLPWRLMCDGALFSLGDEENKKREASAEETKVDMKVRNKGMRH